MTNKSLLHIVSIICLLSVAACNSEEEMIQNTQSDVQNVLMSAKDFLYEATSRTSFNITSSGAQFLWAENDTVGIFPDKGNQVEFPMTAGAGTKSAAFDGGGWGLKGGCSYYAYYPFKRTNYLDSNAKTRNKVSYANQTQTGNGNLDHLGAYDFMAAKGSTPEMGGLSFDFEHLGALVQLTFNIQESTILKSVILETINEDFIIDGYVDITSATPSIIPISKSKTLTINLNDIVTSSAKDDVVIYFMIPPTDLSASNLILNVVDNRNTSASVNLTPKNFQAGRAYALKSEITTPLTYYGHEYVDLGLPSGLKWAKCNIGADSPSDYGDYFAWGETETKPTYTTSNYTWHMQECSSLLSQGVIDSNYNLTSEYDAANVNWGGTWRMPTEDECKELINNCSWTWTSEDGIKGYMITGPNGNTIFLPVAGNRQNSSLYDNGEIGLYWSSTTFIASSGYSVSVAKYLFCSPQNAIYPYHVDNSSRNLGMPIRPVAE